MKWPVIIVERPHRIPGTAWIAWSADDVLAVADGTACDCECITDDVESQVELAMEVMRRDLHGLDVLETPEDVQECMQTRRHNTPVNEIAACANELGWAA